MVPILVCTSCLAVLPDFLTLKYCMYLYLSAQASLQTLPHGVDKLPRPLLLLGLQHRPLVLALFCQHTLQFFWVLCH